MIEQPLDRTEGTVNRWCLLIAANSEEEETDELKAVVEDGVYTILLVALCLPDLVQGLDLYHDLVVVLDNILALDIRRPIRFEDGEVVADAE